MLGIDVRQSWHKADSKVDIPIIINVMMVEQIEAMAAYYVDIFQVGARNSQNFNLLDAPGEEDKPVLLKRGISSTLYELLQSAEYICSNGNERLWKAYRLKQLL